MERGNLPAQLKSFIGRQRELAGLVQEVRRHRLLTLLGPVGIGKTRLALRLAETVEPEFRAGAWLVELSDVSVRPADAIAQVFHIVANGESDPLMRLAAALRDRHCLLVVDNCEAVVDQLAPVVQRLLHDCPDLTVIATSREPLRIDAEREWRVPPLRLPEQDRDEALDQVDSVALFVERARRRDPTFAVASDIVGLVRYLDGLPLALELAAAWMGTLSPGELLRHLADHPQDLQDGDRSNDPRHASLWTAIDSSYRGLDPAGQELLAQLAVFPGGWNLEAMDAVCPVGTGAPLAALRQLIDRSLVTMQAAPGGPTRYRMLGVIRRYARSRLEEAGGAAAAHRRFGCYFAELAATAGAQLTTRQGPRWLQVLDVELDNLRGVLSLDLVEPDARLRVALALVTYWHFRGLLGEGAQRLHAIVGGELDPSPAVVEALAGLSRLSWARGEIGTAARTGRRAFVVARRIGDQPGVVWGLVRMAQARFDSDCSAAARKLAERARPIATALGDDRLIAASLLQLGQIALVDGRLDEADGLLRRAIDLFVRTDQVDQEAVALLILGRVRLRQDRLDDAEAYLIRSLSSLREFGLPRHTVPIVESLAVVALERGDRKRAARLYGGAGGLLQRMGARPPANAPMRRLTVARLQPLATAPDTREAFEEGHTMEVGEVIACALGDPVPAPDAAPARGEATAGGLTVRQLEVADLVADGLTNKQIAARLGIKDRTVESHVRDICNKGGFNNRVDIAAEMVRRRLAAP